MHIHVICIKLDKFPSIATYLIWLKGLTLPPAVRMSAMCSLLNDTLSGN